MIALCSLCVSLSSWIVNKTLKLLFLQKLNHVMMAMAQLLNIRMPGSYELTSQNPDMPEVDGSGKGPGQSGMRPFS